MKYTYEEYMDIKGIKSRDILEKYVEDGIVEKIKEEDVVYIVDNHDNKDKNDFIDEIKSINFELDNQMKNMNILNKKMEILNKKIDEKFNDVANMQKDAEELMVNYKEMSELISEQNKINDLFLEKERQKRWFDIFKYRCIFNFFNKKR